MAQRTRRTNRGNSSYRFRLTERDLWLLEALAKMRFLTTGQLARLYFSGSRWSANKRLRKLLDAGHLKAWVRSLSEENVYSITKNGFSVIENEKLIVPIEAKIPYSLDGNLEHLLIINDVRTSLALDLPQANGEILWWRSDWELRSHGRERIIPDGLFLIKWHGQKEQAYALEVDNNTKSARNFLKKILAYASFQTRGIGIYHVSDPLILVVGSDHKWLGRYRESAKQLRLKPRIWFAGIKDIKAASGTRRIWVNGTEEKYSLRDLTFLPYSKEGPSNETLSNSTIF
jgi:hypothetical protein